jgi:transcriptional regulator with XRE-family HTH domain
MADRRRRTGLARIEGRRRSQNLAHRIGLGLKESRKASGLSQNVAAGRARISQSTWSRVERGIVTPISLETLSASAAAVDTQLAAFIEARPGADLPRDIEHLRRQELVVSLALSGGWCAWPEQAIDLGASRSRSIDARLARASRREHAVVEVLDLMTDAGGAMRGLADKIAAIRRSVSDEHRVAGLLVMRVDHPEPRHRRGDARSLLEPIPGGIRSVARRPRRFSNSDAD